MLEKNKTELQRKVSEDFVPDTTIVDQMTKMGFHPEIINMSLRHVSNNMDDAVDMLLRMQGEGTYENLLTSICGSTSGANTSTSGSESESTPTSPLAAAVIENFKKAKTDEDINAMEVCMIGDISLRPTVLRRTIFFFNNFSGL